MRVKKRHKDGNISQVPHRYRAGGIAPLFPATTLPGGEMYSHFATRMEQIRLSIKGAIIEFSSFFYLSYMAVKWNIKTVTTEFVLRDFSIGKGSGQGES